MKHDTPTPGDKRIYGADVVARIEELEAELEADREEMSPDTSLEDWIAAVAISEEHTLHDEAEELMSLHELARDCDGYDDWPNAMLILDGDFKEYAEELAEDIGAIGKDLRWPACHIDWDAAADALKVDYHCVDFGGYEYWVRA
jgi:hypothetical protein